MTDVKSALCGRTDGTTFTVQLPENAKVIATFEDPPESQCAPDEPPPDLVIYCKGFQLTTRPDEIEKAFREDLAIFERGSQL
jgi:hypothetical protein